MNKKQGLNLRNERFSGEAAIELWELICARTHRSNFEYVIEFLDVQIGVTIYDLSTEQDLQTIDALLDQLNQLQEAIRILDHESNASKSAH